MPLDIPWPFPQDIGGGSLKGRIWRLGSNATLFACGSLCKLWLQTLNTTTVHDYDKWLGAVQERAKGKPLLTICNHTSNIDDPLLFGLLPFRLAFSPSSLRWGLGASNVCFSKPSHGTFCALGKIIPVHRGDGVYQRGMDLILEKMNEGDWAHVFPEGKVNMTQEWMRLKWGMGRLIADCRVPPLVLPFWHEGLTDVLPHKLPYRLQTGQKVTVVFGDAVDTSELLEKMRSGIWRNAGTEGEEEEEGKRGLRKALTDHFQEELRVLKERTRRLHFGDEWAATQQSRQNDASLRDANLNTSNCETEVERTTTRESRNAESLNGVNADTEEDRDEAAATDECISEKKTGRA